VSIAETMTITTDMLAAFLKVVELGSVSLAADALGVGKSAVSKRVAQLEGSTQAMLFSRSTRKVALTAAGEAYADYARRALAEMRAGEERLRSLRAELTGCIRVTAPVSWGQHVLAKRLPQFLHDHPAIEIDLRLADRVMDLACEGIDIALRWSAASQQHELHATPVAAIGWAMVASPRYLAAHGEPARPMDLQRHACLCYWREASDGCWVMEDGRQPATVRVRSRYHVDNPESVADAALAGLGIALLPDYLCTQGLASGQLLPVLAGWTPRTRFGSHITALAAPERLRLTRNQAFMAFLRQAFAAPQPA
jgi:DNA-binding transcriptional LysR family regulator